MRIAGNRLGWCVAAALVCASGAARNASARGVGSINVIAGAKSLSAEDWAPFEDQGELGLQMTFGDTKWPVQLAVDLVGSRDPQPVLLVEGDGKATSLSIVGSTSEVNLGVRKEWGRRGFRPYFGGGFTLVTAKLEFVGPNNVVLSESHGGAGAWIGGGAYWRAGRHVNLGLSLRATAADVDVNTRSSLRSGGGHAAFLVGYGWPARRH